MDTGIELGLGRDILLSPDTAFCKIISSVNVMCEFGQVISCCIVTVQKVAAVCRTMHSFLSLVSQIFAQDDGHVEREWIITPVGVLSCEQFS